MTNGNLNIETSLGSELFDLMEAGHQLGGCPCVIKGYSEVGIGTEKRMMRKALIIEPIEI